MNKMNLPKKIGIAFLAMMLIIPLMFTSVASASPDVCCECTRNVWAQVSDWRICRIECQNLGETWTNEYYELRSTATCGANCSNAASTCGASPNKGYVWGIGNRCYDGWFVDYLYTCVQTSTTGSTAFTCTQSYVQCGSLGSGIECKPNVGNEAGPPPVEGSACQACPGGGTSSGGGCFVATCCLGVDPECCSGVCVDKDSDPNNCGECGHVCAGGICQDGQCVCPVGSLNAGTFYTAGTPEDGCCEYAEGCYDGSDPAECSACYGGTWYPGWHCEEGECIPEFATIAIPVVTILLVVFLISRRKQKR